MAARENQGLQIALIIFVILTIILIVTTYFFFSSAQKEKEANKFLTAENSSKDNQAREARTEGEALKNTLGAALTEKTADAMSASRNSCRRNSKFFEFQNGLQQTILFFRRFPGDWTIYSANR